MDNLTLAFDRQRIGLPKPVDAEAQANALPVASAPFTRRSRLRCSALTLAALAMISCFGAPPVQARVAVSETANLLTGKLTSDVCGASASFGGFNSQVLPGADVDARRTFTYFLSFWCAIYGAPIATPIQIEMAGSGSAIRDVSVQTGSKQKLISYAVLAKDQSWEPDEIASLKFIFLVARDAYLLASGSKPISEEELFDRLCSGSAREKGDLAYSRFSELVENRGPFVDIRAIDEFTHTGTVTIPTFRVAPPAPRPELGAVHSASVGGIWEGLGTSSEFVAPVVVEQTIRFSDTPCAFSIENVGVGVSAAQNQVRDALIASPLIRRLAKDVPEAWAPRHACLQYKVGAIPETYGLYAPNLIVSTSPDYPYLDLHFTFVSPAAGEPLSFVDVRFRPSRDRAAACQTNPLG